MKIFKTDGTVAHESEKRVAVDALREMFEREMPLTGLILEGEEFINEDLRGWTFTDCKLQSVRFDKCDMRSVRFARLEGRMIGFENCQIAGLEMEDTNLRGVWNYASLGSTYGDMINVGGYDDYHVYAYKWGGQYFVVRAGCRHYLYEQAVRHWSNAAGRRELFAAVEFAKTVAENRGWRIEVMDPADWEAIQTMSG